MRRAKPGCLRYQRVLMRPALQCRSYDLGTTSGRFMVFDKHAKVIASHQIEFTQRELS